jgi:hypothetical protein
MTTRFRSSRSTPGTRREVADNDGITHDDFILCLGEPAFSVLGIEPGLEDGMQQVGRESTDHSTDNQTRKEGILLHHIDQHFKATIHNGGFLSTDFVH